jgi:hypothetical protein
MNWAYNEVGFSHEAFGAVFTSSKRGTAFKTDEQARSSAIKYFYKFFVTHFTVYYQI